MRSEISIMLHGSIGDEGFTLVELMIAIVLLMFISLALMQTAMVGIQSNTKNVIRDEATQIAQQKLDHLRNVPYDDLEGIYNGTTGSVTRTFRNIDQKYTVTNSITEPSAAVSTLRMNVTVGWTWRSVSYSTTVSTVRSKL